MTRHRRRVLEILFSADRPLGAYEILNRLGDGSMLAPPTVYRALDFLLEQGLIHKLSTLRAFIGCEHPEEPHAGQFLICAHCGAVKEIEDPGLNERLEAVASRGGYQLAAPVLEVTGLCANCSAEESGNG